MGDALANSCCQRSQLLSSRLSHSCHTHALQPTLDGVEGLPDGSLFLRAGSTGSRPNPQLDIAKEGWNVILYVLGHDSELALCYKREAVSS